MGEKNTVPMQINGVEGAAGQVKLSGGPGVVEYWGSPTGELGQLTVPIWQINPATGTVTNALVMNNGVTAEIELRTMVIGQYAQVLFPDAKYITQWRQFGSVANNGDGVWKLQYQDPGDASWIDWVTGIATRPTADWSNWDSSGGEKFALGIRLVATTIDSGGNSKLTEVDVKF